MNQQELEAHLEGRAQEEAQTPEETPSEATPAEPVAETVPEQQPEADPVQEYLAKYGGNVDEALKAAVHQQSLIGRQGGELGELRKELQAIKEAVTPASDYSHMQYQEVTDDLVQWASEMGASNNPAQGADWALVNQPAVYDTIMDSWYAIDPKAASRYEIQRATQAQAQQFQQQLSPVIQPMVQRNLQDQFTQAWQTVKAESPDLDQYTPQLLKVAEERPHLLGVLQQGTPEAKLQVIRDLYHLAKGQAAAPLASATQAANQAAVDGAAALRQQAAVATQTYGAPAQPTRPDAHLDSWRAAFREEAGLPPLEQ